MKWSRFTSGSLATLIVLMLCAPSTIVINSEEHSNQSLIAPSRSSIVSDSFSLNGLWSSVFAKTSESSTQDLVRLLSSGYPHRVWYPLDKDGSDPLKGAWEWANDTIKSLTDNELEFRFVTEYLNLVAVKNGTEPNLAPILIVGTIASHYISGPGANAFASTVAGVLECARILNQYNLTNDVYFVLVNTISYGSFSYDTGNQGLQNLIMDLEEKGRKPAAIFWFNRLLYNDPELTSGDLIRVDWDTLHSGYDPVSYLVDLASQVSSFTGSRGLMIGEQGSTSYFWESSGGYEGWRNGIPSICFGQTSGDSYWYSEDDKWNLWSYDYEKLADAIGITASLVATLGTFGYGDAPEVQRTVSLGADGQRSDPMPLSGGSNVNISVTWDKNFSVSVEILNKFDVSLMLENSSSMSINMSYYASIKGLYSLRLTNYGNESISLTFRYSQYQDFDWDLLDDHGEFLMGTDSLSQDTDLDFLDDYNEYLLGTDPRAQDSDFDGAFDGIEVLYGSDPLNEDSDADTLLDGFEIEHGYDPTSNDTDSDTLLDQFEVSIGTNPASNDTDSDGLGDAYELSINTDPLSPDSDQDGLSDLFEVLNALDPNSADSDQDGLSDSYEIEHCLMPFDADTDRDGLIDSVDWAPREHWVSVIPPIGVGVFFLGLLGVVLRKRRAYMRGA